MPAPFELDPLLRDVFDTAPMLIWLSGPDKLCIWFNRPWLDFTGRTMEQELGHGWRDGIHPDDVERYLDVYHSHFDEQRPFRIKYRLRADDGTHRWIDGSGIPRHAREGTFLGYIGACADIHDTYISHMPAFEPDAREGDEQDQRTPHPLPHMAARKLQAVHTVILGNLELAQQYMAAGREAQLSRAIGEALQAARQAPVLAERLLAFAQRYDQP